MKSPSQWQLGLGLNQAQRVSALPVQAEMFSECQRAAIEAPEFRGLFIPVLSLLPLGCSAQGDTMSERIKSQIISRRRLFRLAAVTAAIAAPAIMLSTSDARAQTDQAPAAEPAAPKKKTKTKTKKTTPGAMTAPASNPPAAPKQ
jgi:hypothetical protein